MQSFALTALLTMFVYRTETAIEFYNKHCKNKVGIIISLTSETRVILTLSNFRVSIWSVSAERKTAEFCEVDNMENHTCKKEEYDYIGPDNIAELQNNLDIEHATKNVCTDGSQYYSYVNLP